MKIKRSVVLITAAVLLISSLLIACAKPAPTPSPSPAPATTPKPAPVPTPTATPSPTASPTPSPAAKPIALKFAHFTNPKAAFGMNPDRWMNEVEKRSNGRVKFERYWLNALVPQADILDAIRKGVADVGIVHGETHAAFVPVGEVGVLPTLGTALWPIMKAFMDMAKNYAPLREEYAKYNLKPLFPYGSANYNLFTIKGFKVSSLADLKGKKFRTVGYQAQLFQHLGAVPIAAHAGEIATLLERGTIMGLNYPPAGVWGYGIQALLKYYHVPTNLGSGATGAVVINQDVFNKLPSDIQKIMVDLEEDQTRYAAQVYLEECDTRLQQMVKEYGLEIVNVDPSLQTQLVQLSRESVWKQWVDAAPKGVDRQAALDYILAAFKKYLPQDPFPQK